MKLNWKFQVVHTLLWLYSGTTHKRDDKACARSSFRYFTFSKKTDWHLFCVGKPSGKFHAGIVVHRQKRSILVTSQILKIQASQVTDTPAQKRYGRPLK